jgi:hypothetical protein
MNIALVIEGVLKAPHSEAFIPAGVGIYKALTEVEHRLFLLTERLDHVLRDWLRTSYIPGYIGLAQIDAADLLDGTLHRSLGKLRATGPVDLVIDADIRRSADAFRHGYTVMPMLAPAYLRPAWRPDYDGTPKPWDELDAEVQRQRALRLVTQATEEQ